MVAAALAVSTLPAAAHADEILTFAWVPADFAGSSVPGTVTPSGSIVVDLTTPAGTLTGAPGVGAATGFSQSYSGTAAQQTTAWKEALVGFMYTDSAGMLFNLSSITSITPPTPLAWSDTNDVTPQFGASAGNYLLPSFILANTTQTLSVNVGASTPTVVGLSANSVSSTGVSDRGYWELQSVQNASPVPLPAGLGLLMSGFGLLGGLLRRRQGAVAAV
jgi:hypothetical protein